MLSHVSDEDGSAGYWLLLSKRAVNMPQPHFEVSAQGDSNCNCEAGTFHHERCKLRYELYPLVRLCNVVLVKHSSPPENRGFKKRCVSHQKVTHHSALITAASVLAGAFANLATCSLAQAFEYSPTSALTGPALKAGSGGCKQSQHCDVAAGIQSPSAKLSLLATDREPCCSLNRLGTS